VYSFVNISGNESISKRIPLKENETSKKTLEQMNGVYDPKNLSLENL
jgi:hypothetical protein